MTAFVATVTDRKAWFTQDHRRFDGETYTPIADDAEKIHVLEQQQMLVGGIGKLEAINHWARYVSSEFRGDVVETAQEAAVQCREMRRLGWLGDFHHALIHLGWSWTERRVVGFTFDSAADFEPHRIEGTAFSPEVSPEAPDYRDLLKRYERANAGRGVPRFHRLMVGNMLWGMERGKHRARDCISPTYSTAVVDADGPRILQHGTAAVAA